jgi:hypothetical protein
VHSDNLNYILGGFLGEFENGEKANISFVISGNMPVCLSVIMEQLGLQ